MTQMGHFRVIWMAKDLCYTPRYETQATLTRELLDCSQGETSARALLAPVNFKDWRAASLCLLRLAPDAERWEAFGQFSAPAGGALQRGWPGPGAGEPGPPDRPPWTIPLGFFHYLARNPRAVEILVTLFAGRRSDRDLAAQPGLFRTTG